MSGVTCDVEGDETRNMIISLSDLPELALEGVLKYLPFGSIKNMRLVNRKMLSLVTKLKSDFKLWTITSENIQTMDIPDFVLNSTNDIAIKLEDCGDDYQLCHITNIFKRRIKRVTVEVDEIIFIARSCRLFLWDLEYLKIILKEQVSARIPWLVPTLKDSASTLKTLHLVGVGMNGIDNSGSGMVFPAMKTLYIRFSYVPEEFLSMSFPNLEELFLSASGMRKINGAIGPGLNKLKIIYVRDCSGDISRITKAIVKRSQSTLQHIIIGDMQQFPLGYEPGTVKFPELKKLDLTCFPLPGKFFQTHCPFLRDLDIDSCVLTNVNKIKEAAPMFSRIECLRISCCEGEVNTLMHNIVISCKSTLRNLGIWGENNQFLPDDIQVVRFDCLHKIFMSLSVDVTAEFLKIQCPKIKEFDLYSCKLPEKIHEVSQDFANLKNIRIEECSGDVEGLLKFCQHATTKKKYF